MRYLIDTCIFTTYVTDIDSLSRDALAILEDYDNNICMSAESLRELVVSFNNGEIVSKFWDTAHHMSSDGKFEFYRKQGLDFIYAPKR